MITLVAATVGLATIDITAQAAATGNNAPDTALVASDKTSNGSLAVENNVKQPTDANKQSSTVDYQTPVNAGYLDSTTSDDQGNLVVNGWHATNQYRQGMDHYVIALNGDNNQELYRTKVTSVDRPDVAKVYPQAPVAEQGGFSAAIPLNKLANTSSLRLVSRYTGSDNGEPTTGADYWYPTIQTNAGCLDEFKVKGNQVEVAGWHADDQAAVKPVHYLILFDKTKNHEVGHQIVTNLTSQDVAKNGFGLITNASKSRFKATFDITPEMIGDELALVSRYSDSKTNYGHYSDLWYSNTLKLTHNEAGYLDTFAVNGTKIQASGWHADDASPLMAHHFLILFDQTKNQEVTRQEVKSLSSNDVAKNGYGNIANAGQSRFNAEFDITPAMMGDQFVLISRYSDTQNGEGNRSDHWYNGNPLKLTRDQAGYLDNFRVDGVNNKIIVSGWHADGNSAILPNHYVILFDKTTNKEIGRQKLPVTASADVAKNGYASISNANESRFSTEFKVEPSMVGHQFVLVSRYSNDANGGEGSKSDYWYNDNVINLNNNQAWLDNFSQNGNKITISGWHADDHSLVDQHHFIILWDLTKGREITRREVTTTNSPDIAKAYNYILGSNKARFSVQLDIPSEDQHDGLQVISRYSNATSGEGNYSQNWITNRYLNLYQNPSWMYQINYSQIQPTGPVGHNIGPGYEGIKTQLVKNKIGTGYQHNTYTTNDAYRVMSVQRAHGLPATGWVDYNTWVALGLPADQWTSIDSYVAPLGAGAGSSRQDHIEAMIRQAYQYMGKPWIAGCSSSPAYGVDCSGLVMQALYAGGINPTSVSSIYHGFPGNEWNSRNLFTDPHFMNVSYNDRQRGDLVFYYQPGTHTIWHVAIYLGNNQVIESWPPRVMVQPIVNGQRSVIAGIRRVFA